MKSTYQHKYDRTKKNQVMLQQKAQVLDDGKLGDKPLDCI